MSRCFPYPPPGYSRNGATYEALIESIKLQKENDKAKAERKKEKRAKKEKKEKKEKRKDSTKSKLQAESQQDSHKQLQSSATIKKKQDPAIEQVERSDLTEEHGQPVDSHKPSYSSDSTQNSNKRKRDDLVVPDDSNPVKSIKIRLLKKQKGPDSINETSCSNSGRIDECNGGINVPLVQRTPLVSSNKRTTTSHDRKQQPVPVPVPVSFPPKKNDVAVLQSSEQQSIPIPSYRRPEPQIPTLPPSVVPSVSRNKNDATMVSSSGRKPIDEIKLPAVNNEKKKDPITLTKSEKKMMKKHSKYEKLIGGWVPPVLEPQVVPGDDDDDWLKGSGKTTSGARSSRVDDVEMCREMLWQPCARFLVEADVYALPYTVPF
ncbi:hypothetical protein LXL04_022312 [Taraxacum kok-saghyz]